ncbi:MAG: VOC family protein [Calditrichaceae bacterium]
MKINSILETCIYSDDLEASEHFYREIPGLTFLSREPGRHVFFRCGSSVLLIFNPEKTMEIGGNLPPHGSRGPGHLAFGAPSGEIREWKAFLEKNKIPIEHDTTWPGGGRSIYFRDPSGNSIEITTPTIWSIDESE